MISTSDWSNIENQKSMEYGIDQNFGISESVYWFMHIGKSKNLKLNLKVMVITK